MSYTLQTLEIDTGKPARDPERTTSITYAKDRVRMMLQAGVRDFTAEVIRERDGRVVAYYNGDTWVDDESAWSNAEQAEERKAAWDADQPAERDIVRLHLTLDELDQTIRAVGNARSRAYESARYGSEWWAERAGELDILLDKLLSYHAEGAAKRQELERAEWEHADRQIGSGRP